MDPNLAARPRGVTQARRQKNALFFKTSHGAYVGDVYMSPIYTCELAGVNPYEYPIARMKHPSEVEAHPGRWLPWNYEESLAAAQPAVGACCSS